MVYQQDLERAINDLAAMIDNDSVPESAYQALLESNPAILGSLGYSKWMPHPRLLDVDGDAWVPDFIAQPVSEVGEIFELKLPKVQLTYGRSRRDGFMADVHTARNQVRDYARMFQEKRQRNYVRNTFGIDVPANPKSVIVIGRRDDIDPHDLHDFVADLRDTRVVPYDELLAALRLVHSQHYADRNGIPGATFALLISVEKPLDPSRSYVFDMRAESSLCRWSLWVQNAALCFEVIDSDGVEYRAVLKAGVDFEFGRFMALSCELGATPTTFVMNARVGSTLVSHVSKPGGIPMDKMDGSRYTLLGMSVGGAPLEVPVASARFSEQVVWQHTLPLHQLLIWADSRGELAQTEDERVHMMSAGPNGWPDNELNGNTDMRFAPTIVIPEHMQTGK